ncbi:hypothetical protein HK103_001788 [Boothiomyces macroporosus]|uniref:Uncharacterized protein n=1 Tax=Boothiomyces macroporosus TaxID=261099 RepID=A0AAD5Y4Q8_9FUNG|nr:hypothetical protein HK103_001788 [Boothiomyces macroporosus]
MQESSPQDCSPGISNRNTLGSFFSQSKLTAIAPELITPPTIVTIEDIDPPLDYTFTDSELKEQEKCFMNEEQLEISEVGTLFSDAIRVPSRHYSQYGNITSLKELKSEGYVQRKETQTSIVQSVHSFYEKKKTKIFCCW